MSAWNSLRIGSLCTGRTCRREENQLRGHVASTPSCLLPGPLHGWHSHKLHSDVCALGGSCQEYTSLRHQSPSHDGRAAAALSHRGRGSQNQALSEPHRQIPAAQGCGRGPGWVWNGAPVSRSREWGGGAETVGPPAWVQVPLSALSLPGTSPAPIWFCPRAVVTTSGPQLRKAARKVCDCRWAVSTPGPPPAPPEAQGSPLPGPRLTQGSGQGCSSQSNRRTRTQLPAGTSTSLGLPLSTGTGAGEKEREALESFLRTTERAVSCSQTHFQGSGEKKPNFLLL